MTEPTWISRNDVEEIHYAMIELGGGATGLRDGTLLESALARPQNLYSYGESDLFLLTAAYAEGIARNHAFVDGNKRTAFATSDLFLAVNGFDLSQAQTTEHADMMVAFAQGHLTQNTAADHFRRFSKPVAD